MAQVDPTSDRVLQRISVGNGVRALGVGHGALWAATVLDGEVVRIDLRSGRVAHRTAIGGQPVALAVGEDAVWVAREESGSIVRIEPRSGDVLRTITVGNGRARSRSGSEPLGRRIVRTGPCRASTRRAIA